MAGKAKTLKQGQKRRIDGRMYTLEQTFRTRTAYSDAKSWAKAIRKEYGSLARVTVEQGGVCCVWTAERQMRRRGR